MSHDMIMWSPGVTLEAVERQVILKAYSYFQKNKTATANALGISPRTLFDKLEKYGATDEAEKKAGDERRKASADFLERCRSGGPSPDTGRFYRVPPGDPAANQASSAAEGAASAKATNVDLRATGTDSRPMQSRVGKR